MASSSSVSNSDLISVSFRSLDGKRITLDLPSNIEISALRELLSEEFGVSPGQQRLIYRGRAVQSGLLSDHVKESGHTIHVVFRQEDIKETSSQTEESTTEPSQPTITRSTQSIDPGLFLGSLRIEHGSSNSNEPQMTITSDLPFSNSQAIMDTFMSSIAGLARNSQVQVETGTDGFPPLFPRPSQQQANHQPPVATPGQHDFSGNQPHDFFRQFIIGNLNPSRGFSAAGGHFSFPTGTASTTFNAAPGFMAASVPLAHAQQHAQAVAHAAEQHRAAVSAAHASQSTPPGQTPPPVQYVPASTQVPDLATTANHTESGEVQSSVELLSTNDQKPSEDLPEAPAPNESPIPNEPLTQATAPAAAQNQRQHSSTTTTTQTFMHGIPMMNEGTAMNNQPLPSSVHVAVGALPFGDGTNWPQIFSQVMGGQFGPLSAVQSTFPPSTFQQSATATTQQQSTGQQQGQQQQQQQQPQQQRPISMHDFLHAASHARNLTSTGQTVQGIPFFGAAIPVSQPTGFHGPGVFEFGSASENVPRPNDGQPRDGIPDITRSNEDVTTDLQLFLSQIARSVGAARRRMASSEESLRLCLDHQPNNPQSVNTSQSTESIPAPTTLPVPDQHPSNNVVPPIHLNIPAQPPLVTPASSGRRRGSTLWISNEYITERLPWNTLTELSHVLRRATGWTLPAIHSRISPVSPSPLATFLLTYQQYQNIASSLFSQLQAWQTGTGGMGVSAIGQTIQVLALSAEIDGSLASLLSWLFINMARQIGPSAFSAVLPLPRPSGRNHGGNGLEERDMDRSSESDDNEFKDVDEMSSHQYNSDENRNQRKMPSLIDMNESGSSRKRSPEEDVDNVPTEQINVDLVTDVKKRRTSQLPERIVPKDGSESSVPKDGGESSVPKDGSESEVGSDDQNMDEQNLNDEESNCVETIQQDFSVKDLQTDSILNYLSPSRLERTSGPMAEQLLDSNPIANMMNSLLSRTLINQSTEPIRDSGLSTLTQQIRDRYQMWTGNPAVFSRSVLTQAKNSRPLSDAYISGDPTVSQSDRQNRELPSVGTIFGLTWRHSTSRLNIADDVGGEVPNRLSRPYIATMLHEIANQVRQHQDFQTMDPERFPNLHELLRLLQ